MVRTKKNENKVPVSSDGKEESGASKRKRKLQQEKNLEGCRNSMAKFLRTTPQIDDPVCKLNNNLDYMISKLE